MGKSQNFIAGWTTHRKALLELLETFDNDHLHYKPWDNAMSLSELVLHISGATTMFVQIVKNGAFTPPSNEESIKTIDELKQAVQKATDQTIADLEAITDEQLTQIAEFNGMKMPGIAMLEMAKEHEIHHKGQLFTYARLLGIESLPFFIIR